MIRPSDDSGNFEHWKTNKLISLQYNRAICMLAAGYQPKEVAESLGVSERSIQRWLKDEKFNVSLKYAIGICFQGALANASQYTNRAVELLIEISEDKSAPFKYRLEAIRILFNFCLKANIQTQENPDLHAANERINLLYNFSTVQSLLLQQKSFSLPPSPLSTTTKSLWTRLYPNEPYPEDEEELRQRYDDEH